MSAPGAAAPGAAGPLRGLRVLELAGIGPAPFCAMLLADLGADVVRVDRPEPPQVPGRAHDPLGRGKRSIVVNLKDPAGADLVRALAGHADVLIEAYRPGVAERLGVGPGECLERNPRLVYARMTGWGQDGPLAGTAGHDLTYLALTGVLHAIGGEQRPAIPLNLLGDFAGGSLYLAVGILAALREVQRSGRGQVVDAAIVDGASHLATMVYGLFGAGEWRDRRGSNLLDGGAPHYDVYPTADGRHVAVAPLEPGFFAEMVRLLREQRVLPEDELDALAAGQYQPSRWPRQRELLAKAFASRGRDEWAALFAASDACVAPVLSLAEAPHHPHLAARGVFTTGSGAPQPGPAPRFSLTPPGPVRPPAADAGPGEEILVEWAGGAR
jgi:alpha-methylacyl-CoA racemase